MLIILSLINSDTNVRCLVQIFFVCPAKTARPHKKRGNSWHIDKQVRGFGRLCESCGTSNLTDAIEYLDYRLQEIRQQQLYGVRPTRAFREAATRFLEENMRKH
jgi:hypothetical protein